MYPNKTMKKNAGNMISKLCRRFLNLPLHRIRPEISIRKVDRIASSRSSLNLWATFVLKSEIRTFIVCFPMDCVAFVM